MKQFYTLFIVLFFSVQLKAQVFTPAAGSNQINCGLNTTLCDHAGCSTNYSAGIDGFTVIQVVGTANVDLNGSYDLGAGDQIIIYNGAGTSGTVLSTLTGLGTYSLVGTPGQTVTVRHISDGATQSAGFSFTVTYTGACTFPGTDFGTAGSQSFPCATNMTFYDNGGSGGNYTNNVNSTVVLNNAGTGQYFLSGSYSLAVNDFIRIYNGVGTGGTLLATYTNTIGGSIAFNSQPGQTITIQFQTNGTVVNAGFQIIASHYGGCSCPPSVVTPTATPSTICSGQNSQLSTGLANPANYMVTSVTHAPLSCSGAPATAGPVGDDVSSATITLPFTFYYFNTPYTQFGISSNANIQFGPGPYSNTYTPTGTGIPTTSIDNLVALNFADWWADAGDITYHLQGTAPNRVAVICFNTLHPYPNGTAGNLTGQILLYEGTNIIDLVLTDSWMDAAASTDHLQTQGLQDAQGVGVPVPGRNATTWTTTNTTYRFTPMLNYTYAWSPGTFLNSTTITNPLASAVTATTNYSVTASLGTACTSTGNVTVTIAPTPTPSISGTTTICSGQSTTLTATGGSTYLWSTGETTASISVSPATTTNYSVTAYNGSCSGVANTTVTVNPTPTVMVNPDAPITCVTTPVTLTASGATTYLWSTGATSASITVNPATTTTYTVTGTTGSCSMATNVTVTVSPSALPMTCPSDITQSACNNVATFATPVVYDYCSGTTSCANNSIANILSNFNTNGAAITATISNPYNFTLDNGATGTNILDGGADMYDGGNSLNTNLGTAIPYTNGVVTSNANFGVGGSYFTQKVNNMFIMVANLNNISSFYTSGNNGADGSGTETGFTFTVTIGCQSYNVYVKRVCGAGDPSINQIYIVNSTVAATQTLPSNTDDNSHILNNLNSATRLYYLLVAGSAGYCYSLAEYQAMVSTFLTQVNASTGGYPLATVTQIAGLPSGSAFPVGNNVVTFQATSGALTNTCSFNVNITNPFVAMTCPADVNATECNPVANFTAPTAAEPCFIPCQNSTIGTILSNFNTNGNAITSTISNPYNFSLDNGLTATSIGDGGADMYDGGNFLNTSLGTSIAYTNGVVTSSAAFGAGGSYFTQHINNMFIMVADMTNVASFYTTGNNGADGGGTVTGYTFSIIVGCLTYDVFVKQVCNAGDPSINQIYIVQSGSGASHTFSTDSNDGLHTLSGLNSATRLYYLLVGGNTGYCYTLAEFQSIVSTFLTQVNATVSAGAPNATITQIAGLASGSSFPVGTNVVTYQATSTSGATTTCSFNVNVASSSNLTWNGSVSSDWFNPNNWTPACLPNCASNVLIPNVSPNPSPDINATANARTITIGAGGGLTLLGSNRLNVCGDFINNGGVIPNNGTIAFVGTTMQNYTNNGSAILHNVILNNAAHLTLLTDMTLENNGVFTFQAGRLITTGIFKLDLFNNAVGAITGYGANTFVQGRLQRSVIGTQSYDFPVGHATLGYQLANVNYTVAPAGYSKLLSYFVDYASTAVPGVSLTECSATFDCIISAHGKWIIEPDAVGTQTYNIVLYPTGATPACTPSVWTVMKQPLGAAGAWALQGTPCSGGANPTRTGLSTFSEFAPVISDQPMPVELMSFTGKIVQENNGLLQWTTTNEKDNAGFHLQKTQANQQTFSDLTWIPADVSAISVKNYQYLDKNLTPGTYLYRLRQVDQNGQMTLSNVVELQVLANELFSVSNPYPNPAQTEINLSMNLANESVVNIELFNAIGESVYVFEEKKSAGAHELNLPLNKIANGSYLMKVSAGDNSKSFKINVLR